MTARRLIRAAEHLMRRSGNEGIPVSSLTEKLVERFDDHLNGCECPHYGHTHRLELLNGVHLFLILRMGALRILEAIRLLGLKENSRFRQASTSEVYGKVPEIPRTEKTPTIPALPMLLQSSTAPGSR